MATDPNQGASQSRAEELRQANIEGAKFKATMEGLNSVFKDFKKTSGDALRSDADLLAQLDGLGKGFKKAMGLADKLKGFTVEDLKNAKLRNQFQNNLTAAQGDLARVEADIVLLKERQVTIDAQATQAAQDRLDLIDQQIPIVNELENLQEQETSISEEIKQIQKEINEQRHLGKIGEQEINEKLKPRLELAQKDLDLTKKAVEEKKKLVDSVEEEIDAQETIIANAEDQSKILTGIVKEAENYKTTIEETVDAATQLSKKIDEVNNATPAFIEAFEKFGDIASSVPIIGDAINVVTGEISKASKMFKELKAEGKSSIGAIMQAVKGFTFATLITSLGAFVKMAIDGAKTTSSAVVTLNKSVAGSMLDMTAQMGKVGAAAAKYKVPLEEAAATIGGINEALGMQLDFTSETTQQAVKLTNKYGLGVDSTAKLVKLSAANKDTMTETVNAITSGVAQFNAMNNVSISTKAIMEDIANASATTLNGIGKQPGAIAAAAAAARSLGMSMEDIRSASESTTDFQKSLTDEMQTEMMLGKQLNLNKLREAALTGDVTTQAEEMKRLVMENKDRIGDNVKLQEQFASTLGLSRDQYNDIIKNGEALSVLTAKSGAAEEANNKTRKMSQEEIVKSVEDTTAKLTKLTDKITNFQEQMSLGALDFGKGILAGFDGGFFEGIKNIGSMIGDEIGKMTEMGFSNYIKSGSNVGKLLGVLGVGGAGVLTLKAASGLGKSLFGGFKLFGKSDGSAPSKGLWVRMVSDPVKNLLGKITGKGSDLTKSASSPTGFRDKMGRFAKAPTGGAAGGVGGMLGGIGKGIGQFAKGLGKGIEGILSGFAKGIAAFASPQVALGGLALGAVIASVGAGIAGASWLMGKALPTLAEGFESIAELDGDALIKAGKGIGAVGLGMAAMGAGQIAGAIGGLVGGISALFGGPSMDSMFKKVEEFGKNYDFDPVKLENNARGIAAYAAGMAALAVGQVAGAIGSFANIGSSLADGITGMFKGTLPLDKVKKFGEYNFDPVKMGNNAKAIAAYALGMAALAGGQAASFVGSLANIGGSLADGLTSLFGGTLPLDKVKNFEKYDFDPEKIRNNSKAIGAYAIGMTALAGSQAASFLGSLGNLGSQLVDGIVQGLGGETGIPYDKIKDLEKANLDGEKIRINAEALGAYAKAMAALAGSNAGSFLGSLGRLGSTLVDGLVSFFGGDTGIPYDEIDDFAKANMDTEGIIKNAEALSAFGNAMASLEDFDSFTDDLDDGMGDLHSAIKSINKLKEPNMAKLGLVKGMVNMVKDIASIDLSNVDTTLDRLDRFSEVLGDAVLRVDLQAVSSLEGEMQEVQSVIKQTSSGEIAELKRQNAIMVKTHKDEIVELRNQTALLYEYITKPQKSVIKMNTFKVGQSLTTV